MTKRLPPTASVATRGAGEKLHAPAAERNAQVLGDLLQEHLPGAGHALEIASGTGQHIVHFARRFPGLIWHPTEVDPDRIKSISAYADQAQLPNLRAPRHLDVTAEDWATAMPQVQVVVLINLLHLIPTQHAQKAILGAVQSLAPDGRFILYGPFKRDGVLTSDGDQRFHNQLTSADPEIGYKNDTEVAHWLQTAGAARVTRVEMPANNLGFIASV